MPLLERLFSPSLQAAAPYREGFWDIAEASNSTAGVRVDPDAAMKVSTFFAGVRLLSFLVGRLPVGIFRQGTRDKDTGHWAYQLLAKRPNDWQTPFRWKQWMFSSILRWGNGYSYMNPGSPANPVSELIPIHKTRVTPQRLASNAIVFNVARNHDASDVLVPARIPQEQMVHWRSPFGDGLEGDSLLTYARNTIGHALAQSEYAQKQFSKGLLHKFFTKMPQGTTLGETAGAQLKTALREMSGLRQANEVLLLPGGVELEPMSMSLADAQFLQQEEFTMVELAQFLGIPPHMLELVSRSTSWGTGIEQQVIGFNVYTMDPWLTEIEESIDQRFLDDGATHFSKFNRKALLAADMRSRVAYYQGMTAIKAMVPNEVRDAEDMDPVEWGDEPLLSPNESSGGISEKTKAAGELVRAGYKQADAARIVGLDNMADWGAPPITIQKPDSPGSSGGGGKALAIAEEAAGRLVRKEIARVTHLAKRTGGDQAAFEGAITEFYADHAEDVAQALHLDMADAMAYCEEQRDAVLSRGIGVMAGWESERAPELAQLALEG